MKRKEKGPTSFDAPLEEGWVLCQDCGVKLKEKNLERHVESVHPTLSKKGSGNKRMRIPTLIAIFCVIILISLTAYVYLSSQDDEEGDDGTNGDGSDWLVNYSPKSRVGTSENDWWTNYPNQNPAWGETPSHPFWITQYLHNGPVLVLTHSEGCAPCIQQGEDVDTIMKNYGEDIQFLDLLSGIDQKASEMFNIYDPNGSPNYIPHTFVATLVEDGSGNVKVGWHSIEGATGLEWLTNYVRDAIYYHQKNSEKWS